MLKQDVNDQLSIFNFDVAVIRDNRPAPMRSPDQSQNCQELANRTY